MPNLISHQNQDVKVIYLPSLNIAVTGGLVLSGANQAAKQAQDFLAAATGHPGERL
jgi:hypothetical protein